MPEWEVWSLIKKGSVVQNKDKVSFFKVKSTDQNQRCREKAEATKEDNSMTTVWLCPWRHVHDSMDMSPWSHGHAHVP